MSSRTRGWSSGHSLSFLQKLLCPTDWSRLFGASGTQKNTPRWVPFKGSRRDKDGQKVRNAGDLARSVGAGCDRRPSSSSQGGQICSLNTSRLMAGMLATCHLLGSQVGDAGGLEGFILAHFLITTVTSFSVRPSAATLGCWGGGGASGQAKDQWPRCSSLAHAELCRAVGLWNTSSSRPYHGGLLQKLSQSA